MTKHPLIRAALALALSITSAAFAQAWPTKPVKIVVPFPPGGTTDILARAIGFDLTKAWSQPIIVENRPGAGGNIGAEAVAKSPADGYTLLMGTVGTHGINPSVYKKMAYDAIKDFAPVTLVALVPNMLVVHPSVPVKSVGELIALAKKQPGKLTFASSGNGTSIHLSGALFETLAGVDLVHVPYKGSSPAIIDLLAGQVNMMFDNMPSALPYVKSGKLRALAVTSARRSPAMPELPTIAEAGVKGYEASSWFGMLAPAGTPKDVVAKANGAILKSLSTPDIKEKLSSQGAEPAGDTPEKFAAFIRAEIDKWAKVVKASGATID